MSILVTGGAGYIGSHTAAELQAAGEDVIVIDNLSQGHREAVDTVGCRFVEANLQDTDKLTEIMQAHTVDAVIHFAASSLVGESMTDPLKYYRNNVGGTESLLRAMVAAGVKRIVFSSTAAVYGEPETTPIVETAKLQPTNTYGDSKLAIERMLHWCHMAHDLRSVSLRYFNAAGCHPDLPLLEAHHPETHLIPIVLQAAQGERDAVYLYGTDYPTPDGTCIRDYIYIGDLARAHRLAVDKLRSGDIACAAYNLGIGKGFSVRQVIDAARAVTGKEFPVVESPRRAGDPAVLVASSEAAQKALEWTPDVTEIEPMIASVWKWMAN